MVTVSAGVGDGSVSYSILAARLVFDFAREIFVGLYAGAHFRYAVAIVIHYSRASRHSAIVGVKI
jgi:hypothetical protein